MFAVGDWLVGPVHGAAGPREMKLDVTLRLREALAEPELPPLLEEPPKAAAPAAVRVRPARQRSARDSAITPAVEATRQAITRVSEELLYPPEAIARGLEGEALVLLVLDASGNPISATLKASSGHALLDDAAVRAARALRALPESMPRETLLPVRFRLR
ncbi:MAG: TonB family protein [Betaproteobacteria bacterium]|nr:TonB family protein [Betaproteobacteria bacterium]